MKSDQIYIVHILDSITAILEFTANQNEDSFSKNRMAVDAVFRNFEVIGEATKRLSKEIREEYSEIPWIKMAGLRDKLIHDYMKVDIQLVWGVIADILPQQKNQLESILKALTEKRD
jgi:uncharacterized protein with HEPN domain